MPHRYLVFYKPYDVLCQFTNPEALDCKTLKDFIAVPGVYSVGRLDRDSEGLLLLTNHGPLKHRLTDPSFAHPRTYWVQVERIPDEEALAQLRQGVTIRGGYRTRPAQVSRLSQAPELPPREPPIRWRKTVPTAWISLTLTEGRNRQVRRMTAAVNHPTLRLVRVSMGQVSINTTPQGKQPVHGGAAALSIAGLKPGEWRELSPDEQRQIEQILQSAIAPPYSSQPTSRPNPRPPIRARHPRGMH